MSIYHALELLFTARTDLHPGSELRAKANNVIKVHNNNISKVK